MESTKKFEGITAPVFVFNDGQNGERKVTPGLRAGVACELRPHSATIALVKRAIHLAQAVLLLLLSAQITPPKDNRYEIVSIKRDVPATRYALHPSPTIRPGHSLAYGC